MQVDYLGTRLTVEVQEWFYRNVEQFDRQVREWTLEMVAQGTTEEIPAYFDTPSHVK